MQTQISEVSRLPSTSKLNGRPQAKGKFLFLAGEKFHIRGVTYGTFGSNSDGSQFPALEVIESDFEQMAENGFNTIRTYTIPPRYLLNAALRHGLRLMVGLPWEQHVAFLDDRKRARSIEDRLRAGVASCAGHPAVLCYAIGNEIPSPIVRWHGRRAVERHLERLHSAAKSEDPESLVTYVNYPSTEYLQLPFVDLVCFNIYLESQSCLEAYLARLQNMAGDRPLVVGEIGLDSRRHGENTQARSLEWQIRTTFTSGCAGAFVFAWTDEWHRGGYEVEDWDFGLTTRERYPKPALASARDVLAELPFPCRQQWPSVSVVVCSYNGARTLPECLEALLRLDYPDYEVIVVDDGSTDDTAAIAKKYGFRLISTENRGLSSARNSGLAAATGEIVAYLDDDAYPDPDWLKYLAATFLTSSHAGVGGPNIAPPGDGSMAECVANAPGGPVHVLLSDQIAEHIPGCNMAFRRSSLEAIGGFDPQFRVAGDDVDVCWRLQQRGWTLGFSPAAMVWHHRRSSVRAYWKQQQGYGKAEALLEKKWPEKYNSVGHIKWAGQLYGKGLPCVLGKMTRIYHGRWGSAPFQSLHEPPPSLLSLLPAMPEWYLIVFALAGFSALSIVWPSLVFVLPALICAVGASICQAVLSAAKASYPSAPRSRVTLFKLRSLTACLHLLQPLARLAGRVRHGLTLLRQRTVPSVALPYPREFTIWSETWKSPEKWLEDVVAHLRGDGTIVRYGGDYDGWDIEVRTGMIAASRLLMTIEEHGSGKQLARFRIRPFCHDLGLLALLVFGFGSLVALLLYQAWLLGIGLSLLTVAVAYRAVQQCGSATAAILLALEEKREWPETQVASSDQAAPDDPLEMKAPCVSTGD